MGVRNPLESLGDRLAQVLEAHGLSQADAAKRLDCSPAFVSDVLRGAKKPGSEFLATARQALGVSIDWLLSGEGSQRRDPVIDLDYFKLWVALIELGRAAEVHADPDAKILLRSILGDPKALEAAIATSVSAWAQRCETALLAASLYNTHAGASLRSEALYDGIASATAYLQAKSPVREGNVTINIGRSNRSAGRDFIEKK